MKTKVIWARIEVNEEFADVEPIKLALGQFLVELPSYQLFDVNPLETKLNSAIAALNEIKDAWTKEGLEMQRIAKSSLQSLL